MAAIFFLAAVGGVFFLGFYAGCKQSLHRFTRTAWMHDATDQQKRDFIKDGWPPV
jgi:hypothetical protein